MVQLYATEYTKGWSCKIKIHIHNISSMFIFRSCVLPTILAFEDVERGKIPVEEAYAVTGTDPSPVG